MADQTFDLTPNRGVVLMAGIDPNQLRRYVVKPVLDDIGLGGDPAAAIVMLTVAAESGGARYIRQLGRGPAWGVCEMEGATHDDIWRNFLRYRAGADYQSVGQYLSRLGAPDADTLAARVRAWQIPGHYDEANVRECAGNHYYAVAMCRIHYLRVPVALPAADDIDGLARYWKDHYNTYRGAGNAEHAASLYRQYVGRMV